MAAFNTLPFLRISPLVTIDFILPVSNRRGDETMVQHKAIAMKRAIRRKELREIVPLADSTIYEMEQRGEFPRRFALTPRCVVWDLGEVQAWLAARRSKPILRAPGPNVKQRRARPVKVPDRAPRPASTAV
jgi:prophage regulatory protein